MKNKIKASLFACSIVVAGAVPAVDADEVTDTIEQAIKAYNEQAYTEAVEDLNYAVQLINQKKSGTLTQHLPEPMEGWTSDEPTSESVGTAMFGGGITARRTYRKGDGSVEISIVSDSPILQGMMMMFSNPMFAASDGGKLERINRQKAIVKYDKKNNSGEINVVVAKRFLVTLQGDDVSLDDLRAYAKMIDYKKLASLP